MATADELTRVLDAFYERSIRPEFARLALETARRLQDVTERIEAVRQGLETFRIETNDRLADLYGKFQGLQDEYHLITGALRQLEEDGVQRAVVERLGGRLDRVEQRLREIEAKIARAPDR
jgi:hypothetical protein